MQQEPKVLMVRRPSDGHTYVLFAKVVIMDDMLAVVVTAGCRPIMTPGSSIPYPLEVPDSKLPELVQECLPQIQIFAEELNRRYDAKKGK